jgi:hypothetical protein
VPTDRHEVRIEGAEVDGGPTRDLGRVDMEQGIPTLHQLRHLLDRLDGAHLVVGPLAVHGAGVIVDQRGELTHDDAAAAVDRCNPNLPVQARRLPHGGVLHRRGRQVVAAAGACDAARASRWFKALLKSSNCTWRSPGV